MLKAFYPDAYVSDVFSVDYQRLWDKGYRGLLFDVDNTLVPHNGDVTLQVEQLFERLWSMGFRTILVSNNDDARLRRFVERVDTLYLCDAAKPEAACYHKAVELLELEPSQAVFFGDQMFIDIYGANKAGIDSIMVHYIVVNEKEKIGIRRHVENFILFFYRLRKSAHKLEDVVIKR